MPSSARRCSVDLEKLRRDVANYSTMSFPSDLYPCRGCQATASFQRVLQRAAIHVQSSGREEVTGANVLVAMFAERESHAIYFLQEQDMTRFDAVNYISHGIAKAPGRSETRRVQGADEEERTEKSQKRGHDALDSTASISTRRRRAQDDPLIGPRVRSTAHPDPVPAFEEQSALFGDPGVGKTAIAEGLARRIVQREVPEVNAQCDDLRARYGGAASGTRYRGDFEERLKRCCRNSRRSLARSLIDEIHTVIGAGATSGGAMDARTC